MQVIEGADGAKAVHDSWPAFHKSTVHASPLLHDFDFDGILDILVATYDGEIRIFKDTVCNRNVHMQLHAICSYKNGRAWV